MLSNNGTIIIQFSNILPNNTRTSHYFISLAGQTNTLFSYNLLIYHKLRITFVSDDNYYLI